MSSFRPVALHLDEDVDQRQLDLLEQAGQALLLQALALALGDHAGDDGALGQLVAALDVGGQALLLGQLDQRVAAAGRVDQVGGDHRVVLERRGDRRVLGAGDRLPVVGDERAVAPAPARARPASRPRRPGPRRRRRRPRT